MQEELPRLLQIHSLETRGQRGLQLVGLVGIGDAQGVQVARASDLELGAGLGLLHLDTCSVRAPGLLQEVSDIVHLLWHLGKLYTCTRQIKSSTRHEG